MASSRDLFHYEYWWFSLAFLSNNQQINIKFNSPRELANFRDRFYAFRRAVYRECLPTDPLRQATRDIITRRNGLELQLVPKTRPQNDSTSTTNPAPLHYLEGALPDLHRFDYACHLPAMSPEIL
jgi:hypothetical protein